jgi:AraC family transcriptional regulator of adaptative response/methylated-DNA-[protein]-cysteine methyltransferase
MKPVSLSVRAEETLKDPRWSHVCARDARTDGDFVYSVETTGVYCRPSCAARRARPQNVRFHATVAAAEAAGYRPCKRCRPDEPKPPAPSAVIVAKACRLLESCEQPHSLKEIAQSVGLSPFHFHRVFKATLGMTPRQYAEGIRTRRVRESLHAGGTVTDAVYDAGYQSSSRFYESAKSTLGMSPSTFRRKGEGVVIRFAVGRSSLGSVLVGATDRGICAIFLDDDPGYLIQCLRERFKRAEVIQADAAFDEIIARVVQYVDMRVPRLDLPLDIQGTAFQMRVWQELQKIPFGSTVSYSEIAARMGSPGSVRAVASACAANTVAIAVPCHRVLKSDGSISGYRWGPERKKELLAREAREEHSPAKLRDG